MNHCLTWICLTLTYIQGFKHPSVTQVTEPVNIGESPVWDQRVGKLYFVDIHDGKILAYNYEKDLTETIAEFPGNDITPVILTKNDPNILLAGINRNLTKINLLARAAAPQVLCTVQDEKPKNRFNDGKADSRGRVWIGTMGHEPPNGTGKLDLNAGALFKFTKENLTNPSIVIPQVSISNGLAWKHDSTKFYYIDTVTAEISQYDFNVETGTISNKTVAFSTSEKGLGHPDGMTIDKDDNLWIALYGGGSIIQVDPRNGSLLRRIPIPARYTTSVAWGGPDLDILFVTTAKRWLTPKEIEQQPGAGQWRRVGCSRVCSALKIREIRKAKKELLDLPVFLLSSGTRYKHATCNPFVAGGNLVAH